MAMDIDDSFTKILRERVEYIIEDRITQWAKYYFEKELLPDLIAEIKKDMHIEMYSKLNKIGFEVEYKRPDVDKNGSE